MGSGALVPALIAVFSKKRRPVWFWWDYGSLQKISGSRPVFYKGRQSGGKGGPLPGPPRGDLT